MQSLVSRILCGSNSGNYLLPPYVSALYTWSKGLPLLHRAFTHTFENGGMCLISALVKHRIWLPFTERTVVAYVAGECWCSERLWTSLLSCVFAKTMSCCKSATYSWCCKRGWVAFLRTTNLAWPNLFLCYRGDATGECKRRLLIYHLQRLHLTFTQELIALLRVAFMCIQMQDCLKCTVETADENIGA